MGNGDYMKKTYKALLLLSLPLFVTSCVPNENAEVSSDSSSQSGDSSSSKSSSVYSRTSYEQEVEVDGIIYSLCTNPFSYNVSSFDPEAELTDVILPSVVEGKPVKFILQDAF